MHVAKRMVESDYKPKGSKVTYRLKPVTGMDIISVGGLTKKNENGDITFDVDAIKFLIEKCLTGWSGLKYDDGDECKYSDNMSDNISILNGESLIDISSEIIRRGTVSAADEKK